MSWLLKNLRFIEYDRIRLGRVLNLLILYGLSVFGLCAAFNVYLLSAFKNAPQTLDRSWIARFPNLDRVNDWVPNIANHVSFLIEHGYQQRAVLVEYHYLVNWLVTFYSLIPLAILVLVFVIYTLRHPSGAGIDLSPNRLHKYDQRLSRRRRGLLIAVLLFACIGAGALGVPLFEELKLKRSFRWGNVIHRSDLYFFRMPFFANMGLAFIAFSPICFAAYLRLAAKGWEDVLLRKS